jgi:hypothetical protein
MSTEPKREQSDKRNTEDIEVKIVPEGTFAGTTEKPILIEEGKPIPGNTGDEGGGQLSRLKKITKQIVSTRG